MEKNLISSFDVTDINKDLPRKNLKLALALMSLAVVFFLIETITWYGIIMRSTSKDSTNHFFYLYRLSPTISFLEMILMIISNVFHYRAWKFQSQGIEEDDVFVFNRGMKFFNIALTISASYYLFYFLRLLLRYFYLGW